MRLARAAAAIFAIALGAWFAVGIRQAHDLSAATALVTSSSKLDRAGAHRVDSLLDSAGLLYPGTEVELLRGRVALERGQRLRAQRFFLNVTREEPKNVQGWLLLANSAIVGHTIDVALNHVAKLVPKVPGSS